jgi:tetratricopeptide (TPR) repeat protein
MAKNASRAALAAAVLAGFAALAAAAWQFSSPGTDIAMTLASYADRGEMLLHAVKSRAAAWSMPGLSLLWAARQHLGLDPSLPGRLAALLSALAAFGLGMRGGGPARGALFSLAVSLAALTRPVADTEQEIYSLALLVFLNLELWRQAAKGMAVSAAAGFAAGITLLVRTPLFLFPPLAAAWSLPRRGERRRWLAGAAVFLALAYLPLAPWARVNHFLTGRATPLEAERPVSNVITGALGLTFTIEGDARALAGLGRQENAYRWAARTVAENPGRYAAAVARRAWQVFLLSPWLFLLAGAGLLLARSAETRFLAFFCAYFTLVHCLLAIEARYFFPLRYVLALLAAAGAWELLKKRGLALPGREKDYFTAPLFAGAAALALCAMAVLWRYPGAAKEPLVALTESLRSRPGEAWLLDRRGEALFSFGLTAEGTESMRLACAAGGGPRPCWLHAALTGRPEEPPAVFGRYDLLLVKLLRELQLGDKAAARRDFREAVEIWLRERNLVRGRGRDQAELARMIETNKTLWDSDLAGALSYFQPAERRRLLSVMRGMPEFSGGISRLEAAAAEADRLDYDMASALVRESLAGPARGGGDRAGLKPRAAALALALETARADGSLTGLLMGCGPSLRETAEFYVKTGNGPSAGGCFAPAMNWLARGDKASAETLEKAAAGKPGFLVAAAGSLRAAGRTEEAGLLAAAAEEAAGRARSGRELALLYQDLGRYEESLAITRGLLAAAPDDPELNNNLGVLLLFLKKPDEAEAPLLKAAQAQPPHLSAQLNLAALYARRGDRERARSYYRLAAGNPALPAAQRAAVLAAADGRF